MKKFLFFGLAAIMMAACSSDDSLSNVGNLNENTDGTKYMAISLVTNEQNTRSESDDQSAETTGSTTPTTSDEFGLGSSDEYAVYSKSNIVFYFFDNEDKAYDVDGNGNNYLVPVSIGTTTDSEVKETDDLFQSVGTQGGNVTVVSNLILAFQNKKTTTVPAKVVVLVNAPDAYKTKTYGTLNDLLTEVVKEESAQHVLETNGTVKYFLMSNAVYQDASGKIVKATAITSDNIKTTAEAAAAAPVKINVDRVDAKVTLNESENNYIAVKTAEGANLKVKYVDGTEKDVYVKVKGWTLYNKMIGYYLVKDLTASSTDAWWNDITNLRSYWANTPSSATLTQTSLSYADAIGEAKSLTHVEYAIENTRTSDNTGVLLAAEIMEKNGDSYTALDIAKWLSSYYTLDALKEAIVGYLDKGLWYSETTTKNVLKEGSDTEYEEKDVTEWHPIGVEDITFKANSDKTYAVNVTLSATGAGRTWYKEKEGTTPLTTTQKDESSQSVLVQDAVEEILAAVPKPQIWSGGKCYYYAPIKHNISYLTDNNTTVTKENKGIVRNHWYQVSVKSITGLGTPVWKEDDTFTPTNPGEDDDNEWFLDAQISILSWKMMSSEIDFGK